ncbi:MAG: SH3 domain-containing protein [Desulfobacterales bacterium]
MPNIRLLWLLVFLFAFAGTAAAQRLAVSASVANVRSGPGTDRYDILWKAEQYYPIEVIDTQTQWYLFKDFEGDKGWIHKSLVKDISTVITKKEKCNVRSGPGTGSEHQVLFVVEKGVPFKVLKKQGKWLRIEHADGDRGWIHASLVW